MKLLLKSTDIREVNLYCIFFLLKIGKKEDIKSILVMFSFCLLRRTKIYNGFIIRNEEFQYVFFDRSRTNGHN